MPTLELSSGPLRMVSTKVWRGTGRENSRPADSREGQSTGVNVAGERLDFLRFSMS